MSDQVIKDAPVGARVRILRKANIHGAGYGEVQKGAELEVESPGIRTEVCRSGCHFAIPGDTPFELVTA